jgi:DegV family protein with EDD domain
LIKIVTDSTSDLPAEIISQYDITVIPTYINIGTRSYLDGVEISRREFYDNLSSFKHHPTTSAPGIVAFVKTYQKLARDGASEILSIHLASSLSNVGNVARMASEAVEEIHVQAVDSKQLSLGTGLLVIEAAKAIAAGKTSAEVIALVQEMTRRTYTFAALDTLIFLRRSGRVSRISAGLGTLLQVKPLLTMNNGEVGREMVRTRHRALERVVEPPPRCKCWHTHTPTRLKKWSS